MESTTSVCVPLALFLSALAMTQGSKWSYSGSAGPKHWSKIFKHECSGTSQSPVDLRPEQTIYDPALKEFAIWYDPPRPGSNISIHNSGHALQVDLEGQFFVTNGGLQSVYKAAQFHFHWGHKAHHGSEHLIDGEASPIEMHLVTFDNNKYAHIGEAVQQKDGLAVLGVMFEISKEDNPAFKSIVRTIKLVRDPEKKAEIRLPLDSVSIRNILPSDISRYYRYSGSLTTPGCFESVIWTVFDQKQTISRRQLNEFRTLLQPRRRPHHHHHKHGDTQASQSRHRRSLTREELRKENRAWDVLGELGITDNAREQAFLREATLRHNKLLMQADMPQDPSADQQIVEVKPVQESEPKLEKAQTQPTGSKNDTEPHPKPEGGEKTHGEVEYIQEILVNNYRPVQPLNGRLVHRSFKLRQPAVVLPAATSGHYKVDKVSSKVECDCNGAASMWASVLVLLASLHMSALFVS